MKSLLKCLCSLVLLQLSLSISLIKNPTLQATEQLFPDGVSLSATRTLIVYVDSFQGKNIKGQLIDENGVLVGNEIDIHQSGSYQAFYPKALKGTGGNIIIVWQRFDNNTQESAVYAKVYNGDLSNVVKAAFQIDSDASVKINKFITMIELSDSNVLIGWRTFNKDSGNELFTSYSCQKMDQSGALSGSNQKLITITTPFKLHNTFNHYAQLLVQNGKFQVAINIYEDPAWKLNLYTFDNDYSNQQLATLPASTDTIFGGYMHILDDRSHLLFNWRSYKIDQTTFIQPYIMIINSNFDAITQAQTKVVDLPQTSWIAQQSCIQKQDKKIVCIMSTYDNRKEYLAHEFEITTNPLAINTKVINKNYYWIIGVFALALPNNKYLIAYDQGLTNFLQTNTDYRTVINFEVKVSSTAIKVECNGSQQKLTMGYYISGVKVDPSSVDFTWKVTSTAADISQAQTKIDGQKTAEVTLENSDLKKNAPYVFEIIQGGNTIAYSIFKTQDGPIYLNIDDNSCHCPESSKINADAGICKWGSFDPPTFSYSCGNNESFVVEIELSEAEKRFPSDITWQGFIKSSAVGGYNEINQFLQTQKGTRVEIPKANLVVDQEYRFKITTGQNTVTTDSSYQPWKQCLDTTNPNPDPNPNPNPDPDPNPNPNPNPGNGNPVTSAGKLSVSILSIILSIFIMLLN